jgi:serine/threonine-protein kinase
MASTPSAPSGALARALALEVGRLEALRLRAWQALASCVIAAAAALALAGGRGNGIYSGVVGVAAVAWFTIARIALARGKYSTPMSFITFFFEQTLPWGIYLAVFLAGGASEAARVWGPPLTYTGMLILTTLKLSPRYSIITGVLGCAQYLALSTFVVGPALPPNTKVETIDTGGDVVRAFMLLLGGFVVAVVSHGLRGAVGGVVSALREQDLFGKYRLEREVASGGMGIVWLATYCPEGGFDRAAAVKLVHPHLAKDVTFVDAFRREAQLCARLVHQNIVQVFDFGKVEERYFLAMEYVDGTTLRDVWRRGFVHGVRMPPVVAGAIVRQILSGLNFAHVDAHDSDGAQLRVIHRDLAPSNILISKSGEVKLTDFGIARALRDSASAQTQTIAGHFDHMAPEQATAGPIDERTDVFCAAVLLWEMLVGRSLFRRDTDAATLSAVAAAKFAAPSMFFSDLDRFDAFFARALAKDPKERFQSAKEMSAAILEVCGPAPSDAISAFIATLPTSTTKPAEGDSQPATRKIDRAPIAAPSESQSEVERDTTRLD